MIIGYTVSMILRKLGISEWRTFTIENKIIKFEELITRRPILIVNITLPKDMPQNEWCKVTMAFDDMELFKKKFSYTPLTVLRGTAKWDKLK